MTFHMLLFVLLLYNPSHHTNKKAEISYKAYITQQNLERLSRDGFTVTARFEDSCVVNWTGSTGEQLEKLENNGEISKFYPVIPSVMGTLRSYDEHKFARIVLRYRTASSIIRMKETAKAMGFSIVRIDRESFMIGWPNRKTADIFPLLSKLSQEELVDYIFPTSKYLVGER